MILPSFVVVCVVFVVTLLLENIQATKATNSMASKEPVRLRRRKLSSGQETLYLDIYRDGERSYEYLHMYLVPEHSRSDKEKNRETMRLAKDICAKRLVEFRNGEYGFKSDYAEDTKFFDYYESMCNKRRGSKSNWGNWYSCLMHLRHYEKRKDITFRDITSEWVQGFHDYLEHDARVWTAKFGRETNRKLAQNSKLSYFNKLRACLNDAFESGVIAKNPIRGIENFKEEEGMRMYLTIEEVKTLAQTECDYPEVKTAFLFSCLTGLRRSDIAKLTWGEVHRQGEYTRIIFKQKKTKGQEYLDINQQAADLMGERGKPTDKVFEDFHTPSCTNNAIQRWVMKAGIQKEITFHCARHTFATMMLDLDTDLYTVSKLLGHSDIKVTERYVKVLDKRKQQAVNVIPSIGLPTTGNDKK